MARSKKEEVKETVPAKEEVNEDNEYQRLSSFIAENFGDNALFSSLEGDLSTSAEVVDFAMNLMVSLTQSDAKKALDTARLLTVDELVENQPEGDTILVPVSREVFELMRKADRQIALKGRIFNEGTVLKMGDTEVTLQTNAVFTYKGQNIEQQFVGMLMNSHPSNLAANLSRLEHRYDHNGALMEE